MKPNVTIDVGHADANDTSLYWESAGAGTPVLLIHGNFGDRRHWDEQFADFAGRHFAIRYDVRGFGLSARRLAPPRIRVGSV